MEFKKKIPACLEKFSVILQENESFCCINKMTYSQTSDTEKFQNLTDSLQLGDYPKTVDPDHFLSQNIEDVQAFIRNNDILLKRLVRTYLELGLMDSINMAADLYGNSNESKLITLPAYFLRRTIHWIKDLPYVLRPHLKEISRNCMLYYSTRDWLNSPVRCISWHPMCPRLAVATIDDAIRIYSIKQSKFVPILRGRNQRNISCLSWRPYSTFDLAVGTALGIILWKIDQNSVVSRPSMGNATILKQSNVCDISWNGSGTLLIAASSLSGIIMIWDCEREINECVWCCSSGVNLVRWAVNTDYVFSSGIDSTYKTWETNDWSAKKWKLPKGIVQTACWTPCGNHVIFATTEDPNIFTINMNVALGPDKNSGPMMGPMCLMETTAIETQFGPCGGLVQNIKISPNGSLLAIMFKSTNFIAICDMNITCAVIDLSPSFLFTGAPQENPTIMDFQNGFKYGCLLTVAWSTARIQHIPIFQEQVPEGLKLH